MTEDDGIPTMCVWLVCLIQNNLNHVYGELSQNWYIPTTHELRYQEFAGNCLWPIRITERNLKSLKNNVYFVEDN